MSRVHHEPFRVRVEKRHHLLVRYQDGSQTISIPAGVPVTLVAKEKVTLGAGDVIYAPTEKLPDGTLATNKIFQFIAASANAAQ